MLVFTGTGSPRALQTSTALRALRTRYAAADVVIWQVDSSAAAPAAALTAEQARPVLIRPGILAASPEGSKH